MAGSDELIGDCEYWLRAARFGMTLHHVKDVLAIQVEHVFSSVVASAAYTYLRGDGILMQRNTNVPTVTAAHRAAWRCT